jgi:hypothetical protein
VHLDYVTGSTTKRCSLLLTVFSDLGNFHAWGQPGRHNTSTLHPNVHGLGPTHHATTNDLVLSRQLFEVGSS